MKRNANAETTISLDRSFFMNMKLEIQLFKAL